MIKNKYKLLVLLLMVVALNVQSQSFNHPGLLLTNEDFERIKAQLDANNPDVVAGYNNLINNEWSQSDVGTWPVEVIIRGVSGENYVNAGRGAHAAYLNALRWKIDGDVAHAERAVYILNSWASVTKDVTGNSNMSLASGIYGYEFAHAAELMRDYEGWNPEDFEKFKVWMRQVWYAKCYDFLSRRHDTNPGHYWANWGMCNVLAVMSIGVLCDDPFIYNQGLAYYKYDKIGTFDEDLTYNPTVSYVDSWGYNEFIGNFVPVVSDDVRGPLGKLGQLQESGRDQGHTMMGIGLAVDICQVAWNQGDDLFGYMDNRLLAGIEYAAAYNTGIDDLPWTNYWYHAKGIALEDSWKHTGPNPTQRGQFRPFWDRVIGHYEGIKGISLNFTHEMANKVVADAGISSSHSSTLDNLGFTTLTCTRPKVSATEAPVTLSASILYEGETHQKGELNNVTPGSVVKLIPVLPDGENDTGNWLWNTGSTSKELEITIDSSALYRVKYTNVEGVESTQLFSISMNGDCLPDIYSYLIYTDDDVISDTVVTVDQYSRVRLQINSASFRSTYLWSTGETVNSKEIYMGNADSVFTVTGTNLGGAQVTIRYHVNVKPLGYRFRIGDGELEYKENVSVIAGQTVTLLPSVKNGMEGGTWLWSDGSTSHSLTLEDVQKEEDISVTYTHNGMEYTLTYAIKLKPSEVSFAYWPMDEGDGTTALDVWGGYKADMNTASWTNLGANNGAVYLNGEGSSYLNLPANILNSLDDFTISVWAKPDALDTWARIFDFGTSTSYYMYLTGKSGDGFARFTIRTGPNWGVVTEEMITTTYTLELDKWTHFAVTKSGNVAKLYINGVEAGSNDEMTLSLADLGYTERNYVGKSQFADPLFKGTLDELQFYNNALSETEIVDLMKSVKPFYASYSINSVVKYDNVVLVEEGQTVKLIPVFKPGMEGMSGGSWTWSIDNVVVGKINYLTLTNVQEPVKVLLTYTYDSITYEQSYIINTVEDVSSLYIYNPGFDTLCNYKSGTGTNLPPGNGAVEQIEGWTREQNGEWAVGSTFEYGYEGSLNEVAVPAMSSDNIVGNGSGALGISAGWSASVIYSQPLTLPAGKYSLSYSVYNANPNATYGKSLSGWIPDEGDAVVSSKTSFRYGEWEIEELEFVLTEETSGKVQVGLESANAGTGDNAKLFIDYVKLTRVAAELEEEPEEPEDSTLVTQLDHLSGIKLYPTVSNSGDFILKTEGGSAKVTVYALTGYLIKEFNTSSTETRFNLSGTHQMYIVKVQVEDRMKTFKIFKQ